MAVKELREKQAKLVADARAKLEEITTDTNESRAGEIEREYDAIMAEHDKIEARAAREERLETEEARINAADNRRPQGENVEDRGELRVAPPLTPEATELHKQAFDGYLRRGMQGLTREQRTFLQERRTFVGQGETTNGGADGGYLVPQGFMAELSTALKAWGPMLDPGVTRQMTTAKGNVIPWPTMDDTSNTGALISENTQVALAEISFGTKSLSAWKYTSGVVLVSSELLNDSAIDVEGTVREAMGERIGRIGNTHLTTGSGANQPTGIVTGAAVGPTSVSGVAITFDDVIELFHSVDPAYREDPSCRFQFNDMTLKSLRKLKDSYGRYIWQPVNVATAQPATILDKPYSVNQAMAGIGVNNKAMIFGAHRYYVVRRVMEFAIRRLVERYADFDQTGFIGFMRMDGQLLQANAVKSLLQAAA